MHNLKVWQDLIINFAQCMFIFKASSIIFTTIINMCIYVNIFLKITVFIFCVMMQAMISSEMCYKFLLLIIIESLKFSIMPLLIIASLAPV